MLEINYEQQMAAQILNPIPTHARSETVRLDRKNYPTPLRHRVNWNNLVHSILWIQICLKTLLSFLPLFLDASQCWPTFKVSSSLLRARPKARLNITDS